MATLSKTTTTRTEPGFATFLSTARVVWQALGAGWKAMRNRRAVGQLEDLDDYLLADMGLTRSDLRAAIETPLHQDPSLRLAVLSHEHRLIAPAGRPRGRRGDASAPPSVWRAS